MPDNAPNRVIVIGASAGGVEALQGLFSRMPRGFPAPILIVLHLSPSFPSRLPQILSTTDGYGAHNPAPDEPVRPGSIYVAPPNAHMLVEGGRIKLLTGPKENRHRPAINVLFRSAAYEYGSRVIGVVLSGILDDGTSGMWEIKRRGGVAVVQEPSDAIHPEMPRSVIDNVTVDHVVPVAQIPHLLISLCSAEVAT